MTDELITTLAKMRGVRVVSRTSIMHYKKSGEPIAKIGRELSVDSVVEGTVEHSGNRVRIRVQLVQAASDRHLWAQTYDRDFSDALVLQSEAAGEIVRDGAVIRRIDYHPIGHSFLLLLAQARQ